MKELARITMIDIERLPPGCHDLKVWLMGKNVLNNPKAIRVDDQKTGDIVYYEKP